jgi:hypothetical protein
MRKYKNWLMENIVNHVAVILVTCCKKVDFIHDELLIPVVHIPNST